MIRGVLIGAIVLLSYLSSFAEIITYEKTVKKIIGTSQSIDDAKVLAVADAKRDIIEQAGTYIQSITVVENGELKKDEVNAIAMGILNTEVTQMQNIIEGDSFGIVVTVKADVDTSTLQDEIKRIREDERLMDSYRELEKRLNEQLARNAELDSKVAVLEERLKTAVETEKKNIDKEKESIKVEYDEVARRAKADELVKKAKSGGLHYNESIEMLTQAIELDPKSGVAYYERAFLYSVKAEFENNKQYYNYAIADLTQSINNKFSQYSTGISYYYRALYNFRLGKNNEALSDANRSIKSMPRKKTPFHAMYQMFLLKGLASFALDDMTQAIDELKMAEKILKDRGIETSLTDDITEEKVYRTMGFAYANLYLFGDAVEYLDKAIAVKPNDGVSYEMRGICYNYLFWNGHNPFKACEDLKKACEFGFCGVHEDMRTKGLCK